MRNIPIKSGKVYASLISAIEFHHDSMSISSTVDTAVREKQDYCFHCGERIPSITDITITINGIERKMCCQGCRAVALAIDNFGLADYYRYRSEMPPRPETAALDSAPDLAIYNDPDFQANFVRNIDGNILEASLLLEGMVCPACAWLNETHLATLPGIIKATINYTSGKALVQWDNTKIRISEILENIYRLGYKAYPFEPGKRQELRDREKKYLLLRLGLSGLLGMQVMMIAIALYAGDWQWIEAEHRNFLRWVSLVLTTPVMIFSAQPFYENTLRALRNRRLEMDVTISLGITIAFIASLMATVKGSGEVYFDSVTMLVFFLLTGRYMEFNARNKATEQLDTLEKIIPSITTRLSYSSGNYSEETVPVNQVKTGDIVLVRPGETVPVDGIITAGKSTLDESVITGESMPVLRRTGDKISSGSTNVDSPLQVRVTATGSDTSFSRICNLIEKSQSEKPPVALLVDQIAGWFLAGVLLVTACAAWYWWRADPGMWVPVTVATLVATCPCALSLATPVAITVTINRLLQRGVAVVRSAALQAITGMTHLVFDKTGTLTKGNLVISKVTAFKDLPEDRVFAIARALEAHSEHPVARAFRAAKDPVTTFPAKVIRNYPGEGISGLIDNKQYYIGTREFICSRLPAMVPGMEETDQQQSHCVYLADENDALAMFQFTDELREGITAVINFFNGNNIRTILLSGDNRETVRQMADKTGISKAYYRYKPAEKLAIIRQLQDSKAVVGMVGDGINDAPVLAGADISIAMGSGTDLAQMNADMVLLGSRLTNLVEIYTVANQCMKIIRQNMLWAVMYNLVVLPAAVTGLLAPWMAAIGMSLSSLLVVLNSLRINKYRSA